jgi:rod shape-determining protein MreB and related proteins
LLREESGLPITVTEDPLSTVALGSGKTLDNLDILKQVIII